MEDVRVEAKDALEVARERRLDWMNARAKLVDVWRDAALARDVLRSDLVLFLSGDFGSIAASYTHFRAHETKPNLVSRLPLAKKNVKTKEYTLLGAEQSALMIA